MQIKYLGLAVALTIVGCSPAQEEKSREVGWAPPAAGTIVAADSMKVTDEPLNDFRQRRMAFAMMCWHASEMEKQERKW
jgi:hypothetical protein